jgi:hypothetical protein
MNQIIVIGTQPPCPRCKLLTEIVTRKAETFGLNAEIRHIAYTSPEAAEIAAAKGLVPGTAKDVAKKAGLEICWDDKAEIPQALQAQIENLDEDLLPYTQLFKEVAILDHTLRPFENMAEDLGILMTPILIINGQVKHRGSVPWVSDIVRWMKELL